jgi:hypothetical protein
MKKVKLANKAVGPFPAMIVGAMKNGKQKRRQGLRPDNQAGRKNKR